MKECDGAGGGVGEEGVVSGKDKVESDRRSKTEVRTWEQANAKERQFSSTQRFPFWESANISPIE